MLEHNNCKDIEIRNAIKNGNIKFGGNKKLKIFGTLNCSSGRRINRENRVFFESLKEAKILGFRPCGNCMRAAYEKWKHEVI